MSLPAVCDRRLATMTKNGGSERNALIGNNATLWVISCALGRLDVALNKNRIRLVEVCVARESVAKMR